MDLTDLKSDHPNIFNKLDEFKTKLGFDDNDLSVIPIESFVSLCNLNEEQLNSLVKVLDNDKKQLTELSASGIFVWREETFRSKFETMVTNKDLSKKSALKFPGVDVLVDAYHGKFDSNEDIVIKLVNNLDPAVLSSMNNSVTRFFVNQNNQRFVDNFISSLKSVSDNQPDVMANIMKNVKMYELEQSPAFDGARDDVKNYIKEIMAKIDNQQPPASIVLQALRDDEGFVPKLLASRLEKSPGFAEQFTPSSKQSPS